MRIFEESARLSPFARRLRRPVFTWLALLCVGAAVAACGSSSNNSASGSASTSSQAGTAGASTSSAAGPASGSITVWVDSVRLPVA